MPYWLGSGYRLGCACNTLGIDAVVAIEVGNGTGLPEMLDAERPGAVAMDRPDPRQRGWMAVDHCDLHAVGR